jgi:Mrp family chromosome partitioning ATPase
VAAGLGTVAATAGQRVTVMEFDGHANGSRKPFRSEVAGLSVIAMPAGLSESPAGVARLGGLDGVQDGEFVLMSVPSPDVSPAALALGRSIKQSVLVGTHGITRFGDARRTADLLRQSGIDVVAGILLKN